METCTFRNARVGGRRMAGRQHGPRRSGDVAGNAQALRHSRLGDRAARNYVPKRAARRMSNPRPQLLAVSEPESAPQLSPAAAKDAYLALVDDIGRSASKAGELHRISLVVVLNLARLGLKRKIHDVSADELRTLRQATSHDLI